MDIKETEAQMLRVDAIKTLAEAQFKNIETIHYDTGKVLIGGKSIPIDLTGLAKKMKDMSKQQKIDSAHTLLQTLCDTKSQDAKNYISGSKVTAGQLARYEEKYQMAKAFKLNGSYKAQLQLEADLGGLTVTALAGLIIVKGDAYRQALTAFNARIEAFRVKAKSLITAGQVDKANRVLELAKSFNHLTSDKDIKAVFV